LEIPPEEPEWLIAERKRELAERGHDFKPVNGQSKQSNVGEPSEESNSHEPWGYRFQPIDSATFAAADYRPTWIIKRLLVKDQPGIVGAPRKSLKTTLMADLAISLGSGTSFLGNFEVYKPLLVALLSGESGEHTIQETAFRICKAKGIELACVKVLWDFRLPQLANHIDLKELREGIRARGVEVVIIDPLYLCLLAGQSDQGIQASNLFDMGPLLLAVARACLDAGATPILVHHARKNLSNPNEPMELEDLAFSGVQEFARQWLLLNRREKYVPGSGLHKLWLSAGGSIGHGGLWGLDINEGTLDENFGGRRWEVTVAAAAEAIQEASQADETKKKQKRDQQDKSDEGAVLNAVDKIIERLKAKVPTPNGKKAKKQNGKYRTHPIKNDIRLETRLSGDRVTGAITRLTDQGLLEEVRVTIATGKNCKVIKESIGYRRKASERLSDSVDKTAFQSAQSAQSSEVSGQAPVRGRPSAHSLEEEDKTESPSRWKVEQKNPEEGPYGRDWRA
jgi:replicative DNA helicase